MDEAVTEIDLTKLPASPKPKGRSKGKGLTELFEPFNTFILLPYKNDEGTICGESIAAAREGNYFRIMSIPLYASKFARYDLIEVVLRGNNYYYRKIVESSGRNVIQVVVFKSTEFKNIESQLQQFRCSWRRIAGELRIAIDVAKHVPYLPIKDWLDFGQLAENWAYREACLCHE